MKIKNHYAWLFALWVISTLCDSLTCVVNFVEGKYAVGFIFLVLSVAFSFVSGMLLQKAIMVHNHNTTCDMLEELADDLYEEYINQIEPFEEFEDKKEIL